MIRQTFLAALLALPSGASAAEAHEIDIAIFQFSVPEITIAPGDTIRWTNLDGIVHSATADAGGDDGNPVFDTGLFARSEMRQITFEAAGTFDYHCARHPSMTGRVIVVAP